MCQYRHTGRDQLGGRGGAAASKFIHRAHHARMVTHCHHIGGGGGEYENAVRGCSIAIGGGCAAAKGLQEEAIAAFAGDHALGHLQLAIERRELTAALDRADRGNDDVVIGNRAGAYTRARCDIGSDRIAEGDQEGFVDLQIGIAQYAHTDGGAGLAGGDAGGTRCGEEIHPRRG